MKIVKKGEKKVLRCIGLKQLRMYLNILDCIKWLEKNILIYMNKIILWNLID